MPAPKFSPPTTEARDRAIAPHLLAAAAGWPLYVDLDPAEGTPFLAGVYLRCGWCGQGVMRLASGVPAPGTSRPFLRNPDEIAAATLAHMLQVHRRAVDPGWTGA